MLVSALWVLRTRWRAETRPLASPPNIGLAVNTIYWGAHGPVTGDPGPSGIRRDPPPYFRGAFRSQIGTSLELHTGQKNDGWSENKHKKRRRMRLGSSADGIEIGTLKTFIRVRAKWAGNPGAHRVRFWGVRGPPGGPPYRPLLNSLSVHKGRLRLGDPPGVGKFLRFLAPPGGTPPGGASGGGSASDQGTWGPPAGVRSGGRGASLKPGSGPPGGGPGTLRGTPPGGPRGPPRGVPGGGLRRSKKPPVGGILTPPAEDPCWAWPTGKGPGGASRGPGGPPGGPRGPFRSYPSPPPQGPLSRPG